MITQNKKKVIEKKQVRKKRRSTAGEYVQSVAAHAIPNGKGCQAISTCAGNVIADKTKHNALLPKNCQAQVCV
jgi:hypothetical protein